jgi:ferric-dicitrate binding protein FerR (iron transport regulator)
MSPIQPNDICRDPFADVLDAIVSGDASSQDITILNDTLRADPEARRAYIRSMAFEAMVAREFAPLEDSQAPAAIRPQRWRAPIAIAATILLAAALAWRISPAPDTPPQAVANLTDQDGEITHAVITALDDASGHFGPDALSQGLRLGEGMLELDSGLAEITFDSGAEVTLEGPARLQLEADNKTGLVAGRASAYVPKPARGFVIHTPTSYIRDLGTAFAVDVRDDRETDLHVLEGEVEVSATGRHAVNPPQILRQSEAVRLAAGSMLPISFRADNPGARRKQRNPKIPPSVHWSFDSWDGNTTTDSTRGHLLKLQQKKSPATPETLDGPFGLALHFDGQGTFARSDYPGVGGSQARTVACWLRMQPDEPSARPMPNGIIAWGVKRSSGKWQLAWNRAAGQGTVGAARVEFGDGFAIGSTDLRDGRWHHLAVVYLGGPKANVATHVRIYVDGRLDCLSGRRMRRIDTDTTSAAARPLLLGRYLGQAPGREGFFFEGDLDEVHIFEGSLLPGQVERLMKRNGIGPVK